MNSAVLAIASLLTSNLVFAQSFTGSLNPSDPNDVFLLTFTLSAPTSLNVQSWGYGGSSGAPGGKNAAGTVIAPGGFDPYISLFSGAGLTATFLASNDDGLCPPGTATGVSCLDSTLHINSLPVGTYTLALSVFENFSFAENLGTGSLGDLFIGLGNYYDAISNTVRTPNYAFDISGSNLPAGGVTIVSETHVVEPPTISKSFGPSSIPLNGVTILNFTLSNTGLTPLTGVAFVDLLPPGLVVDSPGVSAACGGGTLTTTDTSISLTGGTIPALGSCQIPVLVRGTTTGFKDNITTPVLSTEGGPGNAATATLLVGDPFQVHYSSNLAIGDSVINITNTGEISTAAFPTQNGNICVNVYTFSPDEQLISCCACPVTPDGLVSFSARNDLISNTLTPGVPTSIVIKLLASAGASCNASTVGTGANVLATGIDAWGTTIHALPVTPGSPATTYGETETKFTNATLSKAELTRITTLCGFIQGNGSGFGICKSCRLGGLGTVQP
jgi:uncharacterized repeat protein (TIGR01451 family)